MFARHPADWVLMALCAFAMLAISTMLVPVPLIGPILPPLLLALLLGGMLHAAAQARLGQMHFLQMFEGFRRHPGNLTLIGLFYAIPLVLVHLLVMLALGGSLLVSLLGLPVGSTINSFASGIVGMLFDLGIALGIFLLLWGLLLLAMLFAPALVMHAKAPPLEAMRLSLAASLRNIGAILLLAISLYVLFIVALIPAGLGIVIYIPVVIGALDAAYQELFITPSGVHS
ncbi:MAG: hypothetical protein H6R19_71 [Proteobacteria bacterium]|nr:hypothetical protein [Pseudomonadota bacterium]